MKRGLCSFNDNQEYAGLGGRALTSTIVAKEVNPASAPLGPGNRLVFAPGLLGGTNCVNSGRISVGCKSPMTLGIKEANSGGQAGGYLARLGLDALVIEDQAPTGQWLMLELKSGQARLLPAPEAGLNNYDTVARLEKIYPGCAFITIGRAGEYRLTAASIAFTGRDGRPSRQAARGGVGAVMGSKGLKAIIIDPGETQGPPLTDPETFRASAHRFTEILRAHPVCGHSLATYGSAGLLGLLNESGALPTRNFSSGRFEKFESVSGEELNRLTITRGGQGRVARGCMSGCIMNCSGLFPDRNGQVVGKWPDFETLWAFGPNTGINDLDAIARYDRLCDDVGVDTIDVGGAIALLMEAGILKFGQAKQALQLVKDINRGTPLSRIIGSGAALTGRIYGLNRVAVVKGQALPAFDPRSVKGQGVTFATNPQGADHTAGLSYTGNLLSLGSEVDPLSREGQVELSRRTQISAATVDSLGLCLFVSFAIFETPDALKAIVEMLNARHGTTLTEANLNSLGRKVLETELDFNRRAGLTEASDRLPDFFIEEKVGPHQSTFDIKNSKLDSVLKW